MLISMARHSIAITDDDATDNVEMEDDRRGCGPEGCRSAWSGRRGPCQLCRY